MSSFLVYVALCACYLAAVRAEITGIGGFVSPSSTLKVSSFHCWLFTFVCLFAFLVAL